MQFIVKSPPSPPVREYCIVTATRSAATLAALNGQAIVVGDKVSWRVTRAVVSNIVNRMEDV